MAADGLVDVCAYCGLPADTIDHVIPRHWLRRAQAAGMDATRVFRLRSATVPACHECNSAIGGRLFPTMRERRACAHRHIRRKYRRVLFIPDWTEAELATMSVEAQRYILTGLRQRDLARERLRWTGGSAGYAASVSEALEYVGAGATESTAAAAASPSHIGAGASPERPKTREYVRHEPAPFVCATCGKPFAATDRRRRFCSPVCSRGGSFHGTCAFCNRSLSGGRPRDFCTKACKRALRREQLAGEASNVVAP